MPTKRQCVQVTQAHSLASTAALGAESVDEAAGNTLSAGVPPPLLHALARLPDCCTLCGCFLCSQLRLAVQRKSEPSLTESGTMSSTPLHTSYLPCECQCLSLIHI